MSQSKPFDDIPLFDRHSQIRWIMGIRKLYCSTAAVKTAYAKLYQEYEPIYRPAERSLYLAPRTLAIAHDKCPYLFDNQRSHYIFAALIRLDIIKDIRALIVRQLNNVMARDFANYIIM